MTESYVTCLFEWEVVPVATVTVEFLGTLLASFIHFAVGALSVALIGLTVLYLYRYGEPLKEEYLLIYYGLVVVIIAGVAVLVAVVLHGFIWNIETRGIHDYGAELNVTDDTGVVQITIVDSGDFDSIGLIDPDGTRSTMGDFEPGTTITLRSNNEIISYLNSPENNITVLTASGIKTVENVGELPSEYQNAPDGLVNWADTDDYANASVATVACLYNSPAAFEFGERRVPANVSVPCNTPVLAQNDSVTVDTSVEHTSGLNAGKTLTSPITLRDGEYSVFGTVDGEEWVVQTFLIEDEVLQEQY